MAESRTFDKIRIGLASPTEVQNWSYGEVKKPETINYRTFKPERDGLFCERIFGPTKDWECHCGRYKKVKFKGIICDRCGVEVTRSKVRRERMGVIQLAAPVSHIWYLKGVPSPMALLLDMSPRPLEKVIYFGSYIVTDVQRSEINQNLEQIEEAIRAEMEQGSIAETEILPFTIAQVDDELVDKIASEPAIDEETGEVLVDIGDTITQENVDLLREHGIKDLSVESEGTPLEELLSAPRTLDDIAGDDLEAGLELLKSVERKTLLVEDQYRQLERVLHVLEQRMGKPYGSLVKAGLGAAAVRSLLSEIDLESLKRDLETEVSSTAGSKRLRAVKRLEIVRSFLESKSRPEWMILEHIPVIPPELRPMVQLDGGRFATSDLNDLYRRIINRNNRLKKIVDIHAPESIINHEKRLLQEAVDALIDNGRRSRPVVGSNNRPLRSLSDMLKGKEGRFRKNLLGKRVDYSGRSVIVVGPNLKLHQCGLPKEMALELFKPFVMKALVEEGAVTNVKAAKRYIDRVHPKVWDALEKVIKDHPVMLNRAPTLHHLGIQAFEPVLVDGKAIRVHPLVCAAFGADFDGDQMAVHVPLSNMAQAEGQCLMLATRNLFKPSDGSPIVSPIQDIVLGLYYMTQGNDTGKNAGAVFPNVEQALLAFANGTVDLHSTIKFRDYDPDALVERWREAHPDTDEKQIDLLDPEDPEVAPLLRGCPKRMFSAPPGRLTLALKAPWMMRYSTERNKAKGRIGIVDTIMGKKAIAAFVRDTYEDYGAKKTIELLDDLKDQGFIFATRSALSISITDMDEPADRDAIIEDAEAKVKVINRNFRRGNMTPYERQENVQKAWTEASAKIADGILETIDNDNPLFMITDSGARGSKTQIVQLSGMRGLMADPFGGIIEELPIRSNFHRGLNILEYFVSTHGQRKGLADTALRTADAGYLTRRLVDVAQDVIVKEQDCGTGRGIWVSAFRETAGPSEATLAVANPPGEDALDDEQKARLKERQRHKTAAERKADLGADMAYALRLHSEQIQTGADDSPIESLYDRIRGRVALEPIVHPDTGEVFALPGQEIDDRLAKRIHEAIRVVRTAAPKKTATKSKKTEAASEWEPMLNPEGYRFRAFRRIAIRSPLTCESRQGICVKCYGRDMATQRTVEVGTAVGIIAAQSIGEPGTQLTMRTFHTGGVAGKSIVGVASVKQKKQEALRELHADIKEGHLQLDTGTAERERNREVQALLKVLEEQVGGLLRVVELVEGRKPKGQAIITEVDGIVREIDKRGARRVVIHSKMRVSGGESLNGKVLGDPVMDGKEVILEAGTELTDRHAKILRDKGIEEISVRHSHLVPYRGDLSIHVGDEVSAGDRLTEGPLDPDRVLELQGITGVQDYMVREIQSVYKSQGVDINDKHIEVIVRQMLKKRKINDPGDTLFLPGQVVDKFDFEDTNAEVRERGGQEATAEWLLLGITEASLATDSFLSAASFQKTTKVLAEAAVKGKKDNLIGLKENVIIGRLIPAGTGMPEYHNMTVGGERQFTVRSSARNQQEQLGDVLRNPAVEEIVDSTEIESAADTPELTSETAIETTIEPTPAVDSEYE